MLGVVCFDFNSIVRDICVADRYFSTGPYWLNYLLISALNLDKLENKLRTLETNLAIRQEVAALMPAQVTLLITVFP
jgi:hypothetical protein